MKSLIKFFSSVKLAIVLLIIITSASILGTLVPQGRSAAEYAARYGQMSDLMIRIEVTRLYQSWWYIGLLLMFSMNTIVCTLMRLPPKLKKAFQPVLEFEQKKLRSLKIKDQLETNETVEHTKERVKTALFSRRYRIKESTKKSYFFIFAQKKRLGIFGSDVVHLGLLIILAGGIISGMAGFRTTLSIKEGQTLPVPNEDFSLRLDKFETEYYANGSVKDWKSTLTVIDNDKEALSKVVEVNHPLTYKGVVFYQSSYGLHWDNPLVEIHVTDKNDASISEYITLKIGDTAVFSNQRLELHAMSFIPDFVLNERNEVVTRSLEPNNPAVFIKVVKERKEIFSGWLFAKYPDFARMHSQKETGLSFNLANFKAGQYSGIQIARDPGVSLIWAGCIFLMLGFFIAFYWIPSEIRVIIEEQKGRTRIILGGSASKKTESFKQEFEKIIEFIRK